MTNRKILLMTLTLVLGLSTASCGSGDLGLIDCSAYIDRMIECEIIPPENAAALRDANIKICNNWEKTYKEPVMEALAACIDVPCDENQDLRRRRQPAVRLRRERGSGSPVREDIRMRLGRNDHHGTLP